MDNVKTASHYGRELFLAGINNGANGNISFRDKNKVLITRSGALLSELTGQDFVPLDSPLASSEKSAHQIIHANKTGYQAVWHIHPVSAIALSLQTKQNYIEPLDLEGKYYFKKLPLISTELKPGAADLPKKLLAVCLAGAVLVRGHGVFIFGRDHQECFARACTVDNICRIILAQKK